MNILGIDPGLLGGLAIVDLETSKLIAGIRMPTFKRGSKTYVKATEILDLIDDHKPDVVVIEDVHAMPRQGVSSTFTFGKATGVAEGVVMAHVQQCFWISPAKWKKRQNLGKSKRASLDLAECKFGRGLIDWSVLANDGIAEAALIAVDWIEHR